MSMVTLYTLVKLDGIANMFLALALISTVVAVIWFIVRLASNDICGYDEEAQIKLEKKATKGFRIFVALAIIGIIFTNMIPSTKEVAFIYVVGKLSQSTMAKKVGEQAEQVPEKAMMILNAKMNEYLAEFDPAKKAVDAAKNAVK